MRNKEILVRTQEENSIAAWQNFGRPVVVAQSTSLANGRSNLGRKSHVEYNEKGRKGTHLAVFSEISKTIFNNNNCDGDSLLGHGQRGAIERSAVVP